MYFKEKNENTLGNLEDISSEQNTITTDKNNVQMPLEISEISTDIHDLLKKIVVIYSKTMEFKGDIIKKNDIIKGAITQKDVQSMLKIITHDIDKYLSKVNLTANKLKKSYKELENKTNIILANKDIDQEYKSVFSKIFFYKTLGIYSDKYIQESKDSGVFIFKIANEGKSDAFNKNVYKGMIKKVNLELRHLDIIGRISDHIFAVLIPEVDKKSFSYMLKRITEIIKPDTTTHFVSGGMIGEFENIENLMKALDKNLSKAGNIKDNYIIA